MKGIFFLQWTRRTGKTYVYKTIISRLRSEGKIVLPLTSSGITTILLLNVEHHIGVSRFR